MKTFLWRMLSPLWNWRSTFFAAKSYPGFFTELGAYRQMGGSAPTQELFPQLHDRMASSPFDPHYFYQDAWAARRIAETSPALHVDVGSRVDLVAFLTSLTEVMFVDIRPLEADLDGLTPVSGSVLALPFEDRSVSSLSCLHVAEHIGLGRYGDELDPEGTHKAARELARVLAPGGHLMFSLPVGRPRTMFNAHRIHEPTQVLKMFEGLTLLEFSGVDDSGGFRRFRDPRDLDDAEYACGMYLMTRDHD